MLNRTVPKSSKRGSLGLIAIIVIGTILLPMDSRASNTQKQSRVHRDFLVKPIESVNEFDDVRAKDLSNLDLSSRKGLIAALTFNQQTVWPEQAKMPPGSDPKKILADAMNPGLGVRELHKQGITGKGVNVAILDQPLPPDHPEYDGKVVAYYDVGCGGAKNSMHGPAVASLLVGTNCGTAPGAKLYYVAKPSWKQDAAYEAKALDWIVEQNKKLPATQKIRVVSISASPSGRPKNGHMWEPACARAEADGIMVLDCSRSHRGFIRRCWYDLSDPESVAKCNPGAPPGGGFRLDPTRIHVPASCRTTAECGDDGRDSYIYWARGGRSWTIPYCAGVLAMGWQIRPDLTPAQMKKLLFASAHVHKSGAKIINPTAFIDLVRNQSGNQHIRTRPQMNSETQTIVPGLRVGDYTLDMSKDDVLNKLGEPESIQLGEDEVVRRGEEKYTLNNLPREYIMAFGDVSFWIEDDSVKAIFVRSPLYKLGNGLGVGDSEQKMKQAFGEDFHYKGADFLAYEDKGLTFEINNEDRTVEEINVFRTADDRDDSDASDRQAPSKNTIVPGVGIGDYTLGMSEQVLNRLGQPEGMYFVMDDGVVKEISVRSPIYKFTNGLGVGDSEDKIKQAFGNDFQFEEFDPKDLLTYEDKGLQFEIQKHNRTVREITVVRSHGDSGTPDIRKVIMLSEQPPGPITFPKIDRKPKPNKLWEQRELKTLPKYDPDSGDLWQVDLRCRDLSKLDLRNSIENLMYAEFDHGTVWPAPNRMPPDFDWQEIMELGKNPGLGVRTIHKRGITGKGVGVAIIDQPLLTEHQEYVDRLRLYEENNVKESDISSRMHGPAVASIAVGKTVGVAPGADLYYIATWDLTRDADPLDNFVFRAQSIRRLLEINRRLPADRKIRVISNSIGWSPSQDGYDEITVACEEAKAAGIFVVSCGRGVYGFDFGGLGRHPLASPDLFESYGPGLYWAKIFYNSAPGRDSDALFVPMDSRTTASPTGSDEYVFYPHGGASWCAPYIAGVYALAVQVEPEITPERFWKLALKTGRTIELEHKGQKRSFGPIIDPVRLIGSIKAGELSNLDRKHRRSRKEVLTLVRQAAAEGQILFKRTTREEFKKIAGEPTTEATRADGNILMWYPGMAAKFLFKPESNNPYIIEYIACEGKMIDIGQDRPTDKRDLEQRPDRRSGKDALTLVRQAAAQGRILFKLTMPEEFKEIVGQPFREEVGNRPGTRLNLFYPSVTASFFGWPDEPRTLGEVWCESRQIDIGQNRPVVLSDEGDLSKFGKYNDICGADLSRLDLSQKGDLVERMTFDNLTVWPEPGRLPRGFEPSRRLEEGKTPGLGVRSLHQEGINGSGVGIAIVDGILRRDHIEYADRIKSYRDREMEIEKDKDFSSHAPPVCSIAVGKTCGVAPGASLHYYAAPLGKWIGSNRGFARTVEQIVERNRNLPPSEKVRVISISIGVTLRDHYDQWQAAADKAKKNGILVVTCDKQDFMPYGTLKRIVGKDPDDPNNYGPSYLSGDGNALVYVPIENRSRASHRGKDVYTFDTYAGSSWAAPYLAGLAALAFQVHPGISPDEIVELWQKTATPTKIGPVVNPRGFIEAVKRLKQGVPP